MTTSSTALGDSAIMLRRNFRHTVRNPVTVFNAILFPIVMMLMFVYVFGGAFKVGGSYIDYAVPGLIVMAITYGLGPTAAAVNDDMTKGIINRFKTMDVSRGAVLTGHVVATTVRAVIAVGAIIGVGFAMGFRSHGSLLDWLAAIGLVLLLAFATSWLTVAMGLAAKIGGVRRAGDRAADHAALLEQRVRAGRHHGDRDQAVRRVPALHPDHRDAARAAVRRPRLDRHTVAGAGLVHRVRASLGYAWAVSTFKKRA